MTEESIYFILGMDGLFTAGCVALVYLFPLKMWFTYVKKKALFLLSLMISFHSFCYFQLQ